MNRDLDLGSSTRSTITQAVFDIAYKDGLAAVTLRKVADKADIKLGLMHYYFKTKESLLVACVEAICDKFTKELEKTFNPRDTPAKNLARFFQEGKESTCRDKKMFILLIDLWRLAIDNDAVRKSINEWYQKIIDIACGILDEGKRQGIFKDVDRETIGNLFVMFTDGIGVHWCLREGALDLDKYFDLVCQQIYGLILKNKTSKKA